MNTRVLLLAAALVAAVSCKKGNDNETVTPPPPAIGQTVDVQLKLTGDLTTNESPLGKKAEGVSGNAKTLRDSTVYAVVVYKDDRAIYQGTYDRADSISLKIPTAGTITVRAIAVRRGSGTGLAYHYGWPADVRYYGRPIRAGVSNRMDTVTGYAYSTDTLSYIGTFDPADSTREISTLHSEVDSYIGKTSFAAAATPAVINLPMKRVVFGIRYNATNFTSGRLIAEFNNLMAVKSITPAEASSSQYIYTANEMQWGDSLYVNPVPVSLKWEKPDGSTVTLGQKTIAFKRNVLTTINVTIPNSEAVVTPIPTDTSFTGNESVNF